MKTISIVLAALAIGACQELPWTAEARCADAMGMYLKDPDSIKVISLTKDGEFGYQMHYTATNSFGARVSNTAKCMLLSSGDMAFPNRD